VIVLSIIIATQIVLIISQSPDLVELSLITKPRLLRQLPQKLMAPKLLRTMMVAGILPSLKNQTVQSVLIRKMVQPLLKCQMEEQ
jgi:hypothetical protein